MHQRFTGETFGEIGREYMFKEFAKLVPEIIALATNAVNLGKKVIAVINANKTPKAGA